MDGFYCEQMCLLHLYFLLFVLFHFTGPVSLFKTFPSAVKEFSLRPQALHESMKLCCTATVQDHTHPNPCTQSVFCFFCTFNFSIIFAFKCIFHHDGPHAVSQQHLDVTHINSSIMSLFLEYLSKTNLKSNLN